MSVIFVIHLKIPNQNFSVKFVFLPTSYGIGFFLFLVNVVLKFVQYFSYMPYIFCYCCNHLCNAELYSELYKEQGSNMNS